MCCLIDIHLQNLVLGKGHLVEAVKDSGGGPRRSSGIGQNRHCHPSRKGLLTAAGDRIPSDRCGRSSGMVSQRSVPEPSPMSSPAPLHSLEVPVLRRTGSLRKTRPCARREHCPEDNARGLLDRTQVKPDGGCSHFSHISCHTPSAVANRKATFRIRRVHSFPTAKDR